MQHEVAHRVHAEEVHQIVRVDHVAFGLAHLAVPLQKPGVPEYLLRKGLAQRHQEDGPVNRVEADDILADQVQIRGPQLFVLIRAAAVRVVADAGDIVGEGVQPHIDHVLIVEIHRDAPFEGRPGDAQILKPGQQEVVHHLVFAGHGLNEFRMAVDVVDQPLRVFAHAEEIRLLFGGFALPSAVRALPVL